MTAPKSILKPSTILTDDSDTNLTSPPSLTTTTTTTTTITTNPTPINYSSRSPQSTPPAYHKIKRKPLPTLDRVIPPQTRFSLPESSVNDKPRTSNPNPNRKQKSNLNPKKKVGFVSPVASYIPDPPPFTSETGYGEEGSDEGDERILAETGSNRSGDGDGPDVEAVVSAPLSSGFAANPAVSLDDLVPGHFKVAEKERKEGKWTSRASERMKAGNKMLVEAGNSIRNMKKEFSDRGRDRD